jgi:hypothetical protein
VNARVGAPRDHQSPDPPVLVKDLANGFFEPRLDRVPRRMPPLLQLEALQ